MDVFFVDKVCYPSPCLMSIATVMVKMQTGCKFKFPSEKPYRRTV